MLVADLDGGKAESVAAEINNAAGGAGKAAAFAGDVTAPEFAPKCVRAALDAFGGESIDILVNNAGEEKKSGEEVWERKEARFSFFFLEIFERTKNAILTFPFSLSL